MLACPCSSPPVQQMPPHLTLPVGSEMTIHGHHSGRPRILDLLFVRHPTKTYPPYDLFLPNPAALITKGIFWL